jgi:hypothetical protein
VTACAKAIVADVARSLASDELAFSVGACLAREGRSTASEIGVELCHKLRDLLFLVRGRDAQQMLAKAVRCGLELPDAGFSVAFNAQLLEFALERDHARGHDAHLELGLGKEGEHLLGIGIGRLLLELANARAASLDLGSEVLRSLANGKRTEVAQALDVQVLVETVHRGVHRLDLALELGNSRGRGQRSEGHEGSKGSGGELHLKFRVKKCIE